MFALAFFALTGFEITSSTHFSAWGFGAGGKKGKEKQNEKDFHPDRTAGRHRHHCHSGIHAFAHLEQGARKGSQHQLRESDEDIHHLQPDVCVGS
jgi:hypothetical protein